MSGPAVMRAITLRYTLRNGHRGTLLCVACSTVGAVLQAIDVFGDQLRTCSASASPASAGQR